MSNVFRTVFICIILVVSLFAVASAESYREGDQGQDVVAIQTQLNALGYNGGSPDGDFGSITTAAVKAFQKDRGLEADGIIGSESYRALMGRDIPVSRDGSSSVARRIIQTSLHYQGVPYRFGGTSPAGFDCSGYTRYVFSQVGIYLPRAADEQYEVGRPVSYENLRSGDLVYFTTYDYGASHVGIYLGNDQFISATSSSGVRIDRLNAGYWGDRYIGARRVL